jgi:hypothetical protein
MKNVRRAMPAPGLAPGCCYQALEATGLADPDLGTILIPYLSNSVPRAAAIPDLNYQAS